MEVAESNEEENAVLMKRYGEHVMLLLMNLFYY